MSLSNHNNANITILKNRIDHSLAENDDILNVYFTAGYPHLADTIRIAETLEEAGADMLEIGIPFSDPVADGPTIQQSSQVALENGMTLSVLFDQLKSLRKNVNIPVLLMGYINPVLQYGLEPFCRKCQEVGIDGLILPDLPIDEYLEHYQELFKDNGLHNIFLISPSTTEERIRQIDEHSSGFIYMVSSSSITGSKTGIESGQIQYFNRIKEMNLNQPKLIGFGISNYETFTTACAYAQGAIIGSAFINQLSKNASKSGIEEFVQNIRKS